MKKFFLKQKVAVLMILLSVASIIVTAFVIYWYINKTLIENKKEEIYTTNVEQSHENVLIFEKNRIAVHLLSSRAGVIDVLEKPTEKNKKDLTNVFSDFADDGLYYSSIYLLDKKGVAIVSTDQSFIGENYSFRNYFKNSIKGEDYTDSVLGAKTKELGYYFSEPVYSSLGEVIGVIVLKVNQKEIDNSLIESALSKNSILMLVDEFGVVLSSNDVDKKFKSLGVISSDDKIRMDENKKFLDTKIVPMQYESVYQSILNYLNPSVVEVYDNRDGDRELISIVKLDNFPFYLVVETRLSILNAQVMSTTISVVFIIFIILVLVSLFIFYFLRQFLRPLDKFKAFFNSISNGNFSNELVIDTNDEFNDMAERINKMAKDLSDLYINLDSKVKEQTVKIQDKVKESEDQSRAMLNILEDVELEKSKAETLADDLQKFKLAVENASDQIVITDPEGIVLYGNRAVEAITGYTPEEALGKKAAVLWKMPMPDEYYTNLWDVIKNKKETFIGEIQNKRKNGDLYTAIISISSVLNKEGEIVYFVAIERDITKEKEVDKAKTEFVSLASHQLRTPLSAINWYTEMLLSGDAGELNEEQKNYLNEVYDGNKRMVDLVNDLLNVSRLDMGTFKVEAKLMNTVDLLDSVLNEMKSVVLKKELSVTKSIGKSVGEFNADEKLLRMIYQNLISNAVKYTDIKGEIEIKLENKKSGTKVDSRELSSDSFVITVSDSGIGIPKNQQDKIFTKLFRADNAKESETEGTGLGLYAIKSILEKTGGEIWFKSKEGKGTTFYVIFPSTGMESK